MGYTGINNANAFTGGLMQGIGLYNDIRRTNMYEDQVKDERARRKRQDAVEAGERAQAVYAPRRRPGGQAARGLAHRR
jgi:hypothetical protein